MMLVINKIIQIYYRLHENNSEPKYSLQIV